MRTPGRPPIAPPTSGRSGARAAGAGLHPRSCHHGRYDFPALVQTSPALAPFVGAAPDGRETIDFSNPAAVQALNRALLLHHYGIQHWAIPPGYLCPPIPGRADYVHGVADLLAEMNGGSIPRGPGIRIFDVGVGANCIYPLLGHSEYGWRFVGSDIDAGALASARAIIESNGLDAAIALRHQLQPARIFDGVLLPGERFDAVVCNPPFHASLAEAHATAGRKWRKLGRDPAVSLNFGGRASELAYPGGEEGFVLGLAMASAAVRGQVGWFTSLLSKAETVPPLRTALRRAGAGEIREIPMAQGQKRSRFMAWRFLE